ncbi:hypothetical protein PENTCL1PPCAC_30788, partial [Pristionchus entomophagus]
CFYNCSSRPFSSTFSSVSSSISRESTASTPSFPRFPDRPAIFPLGNVLEFGNNSFVATCCSTPMGGRSACQRTQSDADLDRT